MSYDTLISTDVLAARSSDPAFAIVDCRFALENVDWGLHEYRAHHIPRAVYADLDRDLSGPKNGRNGRHPLPDQRALQATFSRLGIDESVQVVAYDQDGGMYASRLWWLLRWLGHTKVAVLDGGFAKWTAEGRPAASGDERRQPRHFSGTPHNDMWVGPARVDELRRRSDWLLVDARAPERFSGEQETIDPVGGHIPGAANQFFRNNLTAEGTFKSPEDLRALHAAALAGRAPDHVVAYCGSGVTACHNLLALEHAGMRGAKLYPGSWSEWSSDPSRAMATNTK